MKYRIAVIAFVFLLSGQGCISFSSNKTGTTGPAGMFASYDKGETWLQTSRLPQAGGVTMLSGASVFRLFTDPSDPKALYWATRESGFFYSYDNGATWRQPAPPLNTGFLYSVAVNPRDKCTIYATNGLVVYRTDDCSRSWKDVYHQSSASDFVVSLAFNPFSPREIFLAKTMGDVLVSSDEGVSWRVVKRFNTRLENLVADPLQQNVYYLATRQQGLYRSRDGGATWLPLKDAMKGFAGSLEFRRFYLHPSKKNAVYWISTYGILASQDGGDSWTAMNLINPPGSADIYAFAVNPKNDKEIYYTASIGTLSIFYRSQDGGQNWITKKLPSDQRPTALLVDPVDPAHIHIGFTVPPPPK